MKDRASLEARCSWQTTAEHRHLLTNLTHRLNKGTPAYITLVFEEDAEGSKWKSLCAQNSKHTNKIKNLRTSLLLLVAGTQSSLSCYASLDSTLIENMEYVLIQHPHVNVSIVADSWNNSPDIMFSKHYGWYCTEWLIVMFYDQFSQYCFGITLYITVRIRTDATLKKNISNLVLLPVQEQQISSTSFSSVLGTMAHSHRRWSAHCKCEAFLFSPFWCQHGIPKRVATVAWAQRPSQGSDGSWESIPHHPCCHNLDNCKPSPCLHTQLDINVWKYRRAYWTWLAIKLARWRYLFVAKS